MTGRLHRFDALDNFRDYGDYAVAGGRRIRPGRLYRSAHHARLSDGDLDRLAGFGIATVVDMRRPVERRRQPSRRPPGFSAAVIENDHDPGGEAPHITFLKTAELTAESGRRFMTDTYRRLPFEPAHLDLFQRYFEAVAGDDGPVLIHCAAGKDRTGLLAALTHHLLGVHRDDLVDDYLLTNQAVDLEARAPDIADQLKALSGRRADTAAVVAFMGVEAGYLEAAIGAMTDRFGSVDAYLERGLGVDAARRDRILARLTE